jgi:hypothetical protein
MNSACNCCQQPPDGNGFYIGIRVKSVRAKFCAAFLPSVLGGNVLSAYESLATPDLVPSNPSNPLSGELYTDITVNYSKRIDEEIPASEGICFDVAGGSSYTDKEITLTRTVDPNKKIKTADLYRDSPIEQSCPSDCGSSSNPVLTGNSFVEYYTERTLTSLVQGGCGADYLNSCGNCPDDIYCYGGGSNPIVLTQTSKETFTTSVNGCALSGSFSYTDYPSANGEAITTQTSESNCCFAFVCNSEVFGHPSGQQETTDTDPYNIVIFPPLDENTTAQALAPIDISDVIDAAKQKLNDTDYFVPNASPIGDTTFDWSYGAYDPQSQAGNPYTPLSAGFSIYSSPFSESGFGNNATVDLSEIEYVIATGQPTGTCYIKLWFEEHFLPYPLPEDWPIDEVTLLPIPIKKSEFQIEHDFAKTEENLCYLPPDQINGYSPDLLFNPDNLVKIMEPKILTPPEEAGSKYVKILKYSYVKGYEPNDPYIENGSYTQGCKPNGFPAPQISC